VDQTHPLYFLCDGDPRGWWGDGITIDADDEPLGSLLWLLERAPMTIAGLPASQWAILFASEALQTLKDQGVCARIDVTATQDNVAGMIKLLVKLYARDGTVIFDHQFDLLWSQVAS
jgi:phage gp46-like protein